MRQAYQERRALGCRVQLALVVDDDCDADRLFAELWWQILTFEQRCSRFLPDSELSQLNRSAGVRLPVSPELRDILVTARRLANQTGGLYNPFVLPALQRVGYVGSLDSGREQDEVDDFSRRQVVSADRLEIGLDWVMIPYGSALDLGGCGKGYLGDLLAGQTLGDDHVVGFWFALGGDVIAYGHDDQGSPWRIYIQPEPQSNRIGEAASAGDGLFAVATSTTRLRQGRSGGKRWHHIIDPRTGLPAVSDITVTTICGDSLLEADVLASCAIIAGSSELREMARRHRVDIGWQRRRGSRMEVFGDTIIAYPVVDK